VQARQSTTRIYQQLRTATPHLQSTADRQAAKAGATLNRHCQLRNAAHTSQHACSGTPGASDQTPAEKQLLQLTCDSLISRGTNLLQRKGGQHKVYIALVGIPLHTLGAKRGVEKLRAAVDGRREEQ
jgi:hypothetical protein